MCIGLIFWGCKKKMVIYVCVSVFFFFFFFGLPSAPLLVSLNP